MITITPNPLFITEEAIELSIVSDVILDVAHILIKDIECTDITIVSPLNYTCKALLPMSFPRGFTDVIIVTVDGEIHTFERAIRVISPITIGETGKYFYIGSNYKQQEQANSIIDEVRFLNKASTDEEIYFDWILLKKLGLHFRAQEGTINLTEAQSLLIANEAERITRREVGNFTDPLTEAQLTRVETIKTALTNRLNMPDNTLLLMHFDNNTKIEPNVGALQTSEKPLIDTRSSINSVDITVYYPSDTTIDEELIKDALNNLKPAIAKLYVQFRGV